MAAGPIDGRGGPEVVRRRGGWPDLTPPGVDFRLQLLPSGFGGAVGR